VFFFFKKQMALFIIRKKAEDQKDPNFIFEESLDSIKLLQLKQTLKMRLKWCQCLRGRGLC